MTNLENLLKNDAEKLAEILVTPYHDRDGSFIGYIGPNQVIYLIYNPERVRMNISSKTIKGYVFEANLDPYDLRKKCIEAAKEWLRQICID